MENKNLFYMRVKITDPHFFFCGKVAESVLYAISYQIDKGFKSNEDRNFIAYQHYLRLIVYNIYLYICMSKIFLRYILYI